MLHQPVSTFEPSQPAPATARPFDAKRYLQRAQALGIMLFPSIFSTGTRTFGLCAYPGYSFSVGNERLAKEFAADLNASSDGSATIFEALCADFGLDVADVSFNDKVNAICRARSRASTDGDKRLIELCKRAKLALEKDIVATNLHCDITEEFEKVEPKRPTYVTALGAELQEHGTAQSMRGHLADCITEWPRTAVQNYRARIAKVVAYEKECDRVKREIGLTKAEAAENAASRRAKMLVGDVAALSATTMPGLACKAAILTAWEKAGYGLDPGDEGERLAFSIAEDARMLGTSESFEKAAGGRRRQPSAQVH